MEIADMKLLRRNKSIKTRFSGIKYVLRRTKHANASYDLQTRTHTTFTDWDSIIATSMIFVALKTSLSRQNTSFVASNICLSRQTYFCRNKSFVATNIWRDIHNFVATNVNVCRDKLTFVATNMCFFCRDKSMLVSTKLLSRQNFCLDKHGFVAKNIFRNKRHPRVSVCVTSTRLSRQKSYL